MSTAEPHAQNQLSWRQKRFIRLIALEAAEDGYEAGFRGDELAAYVKERVERRLKGRLKDVDWYLVLEFLKILMPLIIALLI